MKKLSTAYRWGIVFVLTIILLLLLVSLAKRNNVSTQIRENITGFQKNNHYLSLIDSSIYKLLHIENNLHLYTVTKNKEYHSKYVSALGELSFYIDSLEKILPARDTEINLNHLVDQKIDKSKIFIHLRAVNDSLIMFSSDISEGIDFKDVNLRLLPVEINRLDSVVIISNTNIVPVKMNKNLLARLRDAILNRGIEFDTLSAIDRSMETIIKTNSDSVRASKENNEQKIKEYNAVVRGAVNRLIATHDKLKKKETELFITNNELLVKLSEAFKELKAYEKDNLENKKLQIETTKNLTVLEQILEYVLIISIILVAIILSNIWHLFNNERKLKKAKDIADRQTKIKTDFLAQMSHEIRTPLNSILGFSEQLGNSSLSEQQKENLDAVKRSSQVLLSIVNDVLDLSKIETGKLNIQSFLFHPKKTVDNVISTLKIHADKKGLELIVNCSFDEKLLLRGDEYRLKQVIINLVNNAIKFTKKGYVKLNVTVNSQCVLKAEVIDTGVGIDNANLDNIFNEFMQIVQKGDINRHNGTGLGLAICKKIVEAQNGIIGVESELGKGSKFYFEIPYSECSDIQIAEEKETIDEQGPIDLSLIKEKRILLVDDNMMNRMLLKVIFDKWGVNYDEAEDGTEAFDLFTQKNYHIILTDIQMPNMDGLELTRKIRSLEDADLAKIPIIAVTANAIKTDEDKYKKAGIDDVLVKPFKEDVLYYKITKYV